MWNTVIKSSFRRFLFTVPFFYRFKLSEHLSTFHILQKYQISKMNRFSSPISKMFFFSLEILDFFSTVFLVTVEVNQGWGLHPGRYTGWCRNICLPSIVLSVSIGCEPKWFTISSRLSKDLPSTSYLNSETTVRIWIFNGSEFWPQVMVAAKSPFCWSQILIQTYKKGLNSKTYRTEFNRRGILKVRFYVR